MTDVTNNRNAPTPIVRKQWVRNGFSPVAEFQNKLTDLAAYAAYCRPKVVFQRACPIDDIPAAGGASRTRWRFSWNSGPYAESLYVTMLMARRTSLTGVASSVLQIAKLSDATTLAWASAVCGEFTANAPSGAISFVDAPSNMGATTGRLHAPGDVTTAYVLVVDTMYVARFVDQLNGRLASAVVWEQSKQSATDYGFTSSGVATGSPIYANDRDAIADVHRALHTRGAAQLWNHCSQTDALAFVAAATASGGVLAESIGNITLDAQGTIPRTGDLNESIGNITGVLTGTVSGYAMTIGVAMSSSSISPLGTLSTTVAVHIAGGTQTSVQVLVGVVTNAVYAPVDTALAGFTRTSGWTHAAGVWNATYQRASVPVGDYSITFDQSMFGTTSGGTIYCGTSGSSTQVATATPINIGGTGGSPGQDSASIT